MARPPGLAARLSCDRGSRSASLACRARAVSTSHAVATPSPAWHASPERGCHTLLPLASTGKLILRIPTGSS